MELALSAIAMIVAVTVVLGVVGYLIDRSAARHEREKGDSA
jgi:hypothetical protein